MLEVLDAAEDYVFNLSIESLLSHIDPNYYFSRLANLNSESSFKERGEGLTEEQRGGAERREGGGGKEEEAGRGDGARGDLHGTFNSPPPPPPRPPPRPHSTPTLQHLITQTHHAELELTFGAPNIRKNYERALFGMKIFDAEKLAGCIKTTDVLTSLVLPCNLLDDELLTLLMGGLIQNQTVTHLDLSHNKWVLLHCAVLYCVFSLSLAPLPSSHPLPSPSQNHKPWSKTPVETAWGSVCAHGLKPLRQSDPFRGR